MKPMSESVISKVGFWQGLVVSLIAVVTSIVTIGVVFGGSLNRLARVEEELKETKQSVSTVRSDIEGRLERIEEKMVNKDDFKEVKADVKELLRQRR